MPSLRHTVIGISPFENPDPALVLALGRAGALGVLDLGRDAALAARGLQRVASRARAGFGVRVPEGVVGPELPDAVNVVVLADADAERAGDFGARRVLVQVTSVDGARRALAAGATGLIAKGNESGGRVGDETSFVLLQHLVKALGSAAPIWVQGGVGLHTAAAAVAGGAIGVVLDGQLALVRESCLSPRIKAAVRAMDGSETVVRGGHRLFTRPDLPVAKLDEGINDEAIRDRLGARSLSDDLLAAGQDTAFASTLARRFATAGGVVTAIASSLDEHLRGARAHRPLAAGAPLAEAHGIEYPIAQGPMSRVSDRASFAHQVALAGGLPFLALSLSNGESTAALLEQTRELLGERTWGVGLLGFAPPAIREAQLEAIARARPRVALIAGGRPSQAKPLEDAGTATYLHVPSPGLLDLFLKEGARRFVFEGRECGGHVGPRSSFVLWEAQIERLLAFDRLDEVHVLFAGGIHDARSAAMVAAMVAPLAARGAKVGVLMGTAYLFTREAVDSGAIEPGFQDAAVECEGTALLETAPGHATRCVSTAYVDSFRDAKAALERSGADPKQMWAELEQLNLGRLRMAAKGIRRRGDALERVEPEEQRSEGMFMVGQVAALRSRVGTIAELHADVADGARLLERISLDEVASDEARPARVAVVGLACMFPGAPDTASFWANVVNGHDAITEVPPDRWNPELYYDPDATGASAGRKTPSKWGGFLDAIAFDPIRYGIPPKSLAAIEPVQLLSLEVARRALADAGYAEREFARERTSVIFGAEAGTELSGAYGFRAVYPQLAGELLEALDDHLPTLTEDSFPGVLANVIAGRIANRLDLGGVNYTVDAACASSLAAVDLAVKELVAGTSDMVLCGGADVHNSINDYLLFSSVHALSPRGRCRAFDSSADGIVLGEGVGCVVLKRLEDAERDGDRIYAVIDGVAGSSDGRSLGLTAPRKEGQKRALERAYRRAGISPAEVGLVEAHGTGTVVGDRTELATLTEVFGDAGAEVAGCTLGSVKSQIGHTKCAAAVASLIKTSLALHNRVRPPTLHIQEPNPGYDPDQSPFHFADVARPWLGQRRRAALSALGFGGTNFHAVLSSYDEADAPDCAVDVWPCELLLFRGADRDAAAASMAHFERALDGDGVRLRDLAWALALQTGPIQVAVIADDIDDARSKLPRARAFQMDPDHGVYVAEPRTQPPRVAFVFPGQGSQRVNMLAELFTTFPRLQRYLRLGAEYVDRMYPPQAFCREHASEQRAALTDTRVAQPALGIADLAMADVLAAAGVRPSMVGGHSYGELAALCSAGVFSPQTLIELSAARGQCILEAAGDDPGSMAAVRGSAAAIAEVLGSDSTVVIANRNAPEQTVISGPSAAVDEAIAALDSAGLRARSIPVACAFHSPVVERAADALRARLDEVPMGAPSTVVYANSTASPYPEDIDEIRSLLAGQVARPVRFAEQIEAMYAAGARVFVECGPGRVLSGLIGKILGDRPHQAIPCDVAGQHGVRQLLTALATLAAHGVEVDLAALFEGRDVQELDMTTTPAKQSPSTWRVNGYTAAPVHGEAPSIGFVPAAEPVAQVGLAPATSPAAAPASAEQPVVDFLRNMREMVAAQRDVVLAYLGQAPVVAAAPRPPVIAATATEVVAPAPVIEATPPPRSTAEILLAIVSDRTGYPVQMLDLDLDLEAELSIDSIKRIEILGELREQVGLTAPEGASDEELIEELAALKTLRGIIDWLAAHQTGEPVAAEPALAEPAAIAPEAAVAIPLSRYEVRLERAPPPALNGTSLEERRFALTDDGRGFATAVAAMLESHGASAVILGDGDHLGEVDGLIDLGCLERGASHGHLERLFELTREAVLGDSRWVMSVTGRGGTFGRDRRGHGPAGVSGLMRTVAREHSDRKVRVLDIDPETSSP